MFVSSVLFWDGMFRVVPLQLLIVTSSCAISARSEQGKNFKTAKKMRQNLNTCQRLFNK